MKMANPKNELVVGGSGVLCATPEETRRLARALTKSLDTNATLCLNGPLGAGKTEFVKGLAEGLNCREAVTSPSFAIAHEYEGEDTTLFHFDFYRMEEATEVETCGLEDCLGRGVIAIEWGEKFPEALPARLLKIRIVPEGLARRIFIEYS